MQTLQLKIFVIDNQGHTSIRANQKANFEGRTIGCDAESGLGLPNWASIAVAYGFSPIEIRDTNLTSSEVRNAVSSKGPEFFIVKVDPEQINFPRISTQVTPEGLAKSNPLHIMSPELSLPEKLQYLPYLQTEG
jgi:acetolactate synthase-1/2/3 large subunit